MTSGRFSQLPPAGSRATREEVGRLWSLADPADALRTALTRLLGSDEIHLVASGREALRLALDGAARERGRREVVIPAYTCFSVASAAVAAGLRVRLVDVDARGRIDAAALASLPLEGVAAIVV